VHGKLEQKHTLNVIFILAVGAWVVEDGTGMGGVVL
jgi:hypothetical protein